MFILEEIITKKQRIRRYAEARKIFKEQEERINRDIIRAYEKKIEEIAELLYEHSMRSENWTEIIPFEEISEEYKQDLLSLAKEIWNITRIVDVTTTGMGI